MCAAKDDDIIIARARAAKEFGRPISSAGIGSSIFPGRQKTGACLETEAPIEKKQTDFINAWRHIWTVFQREGATNVVWVWNPNSTVPAGALDPRGFYPGDEYVDWIAWDKYDQEGGTPFEKLFADFVTGYGKMGKPLLIGETGAHPQFQSRYLQPAATALKGPYSQIKAIVYFDAPGHRKLPWTLSDKGIAALKKMWAGPHFQAMQPENSRVVSAGQGCDLDRRNDGEASTRREFLKTASLVTLGSGLPKAVRAHKERRNVLLIDAGRTVWRARNSMITRPMRQSE